MNVIAGEKTTLESQKVQEYVAECFQHAESSDNNQRMFIIIHTTCTSAAFSCLQTPPSLRVYY